MTNKFINVFFKEKQLDERTYEVEHDGMTHFVDSEFVIELIKSCGKEEQKNIEMTLRKIDFHNGDVHHFLKHLALGYVVGNY